MLFFAGLSTYACLMQLLKCIESIYCPLLSLLLLFSFLSNQGNLYMVHLVQKTFLWHLQCNKWTQSKIKSLILIYVSNPIWYLLKIDPKNISRTSFALSLILIFMLSRFECIISSSSLSLEEIKLIAIVNSIFPLS